MALSSPRLQQFRQQIDEIDQELVRSLNRRAELTIDELQRTGKAIPRAFAHQQFTADLIGEIVARNRGPIPSSALEGIYREILHGSFELARPIRVGYLGPFGTFSHQAAMQYFGEHVDYENLRTLQGVFEEVARGHVDYGLVPIENSTGGAIIESLDSFASYVGRVTIYGEVRLNIRFSLFGNCSPEEIKRIYSKAEALAQCYDWLAEHYPAAERIPYESTAAAVELAYLSDPADGIAAVGSAVAGKKYGLQPLQENIETQHDNMTRFLILSRTPAAKTSHDKTSLMFTCSDRPGSLVNILSVFKQNQINLSHIEKRPSRELGSDYTFFVDMVGHAQDGEIAEVLGEVRAHCRTLIVLGSFPVYDPVMHYQSQKMITPAPSMQVLKEETLVVDSEIIERVNKRASLVIQVGEFKRQHDSPIYAPHRESAVLAKIQRLNSGPLRDRTLEAIYRELMSGSFRLEKPLRIGYVGPVGEFDHLAAVRHFGSSVDFVPVGESRAIFRLVAAEEIDYGLVPIENSSIGGVNESLDAFFNFHDRLNIYGEVKLEIHYALLADCKPEEIRRIHATPAVFELCRNWLSTQYPHVPRITVKSTQLAIEQVKAENELDPDSGSAAIGSPLMGLQNGMRPLFEGIEDRLGNITRYLILSKSRTEISGNDKTSLMFTVNDRPGALVDVLDVFRRNAINLTHLEKRPSGQTLWDYTFFVDLEGHRSDPKIGEGIGEARAQCKSLIVLGSFPACQRVL
jgi:chorismate mutase / prephenate dehydratase